MTKKHDTETFVKMAMGVHGDTYDYSESVYKGYKKLLKIICKIHGEFYQKPNTHISCKCGCPECGKIVLGFGRTNDLNQRLTQHKKDLVRSGATMKILRKIVTKTREESIAIETRLKELWNKQELDISAAFRTEWIEIENLDKALSILH